MKPFSATSRKRSQVMARFRRRSLQPRIVLVDPGGVEVVTLALEEGGGPAMLHLDHVAHLQLAAKRWGCTVRLYGASPELIELLEIFNLNQVITIVRFPRLTGCSAIPSRVWPGPHRSPNVVSPVGRRAVLP